MKKVGIITLYGNSNYGNKLQNYALQEVIKKLGFEVETIAYKFEGNTILNRIKTKIIKFIKNLCNLKNCKTIINRNKNFTEFNKMITYTKELKYNKIDNYDLNYDFIVVGSDQIWGPMAVNIPKIAFAEFSEKEKNISYAASFGVNEIKLEDKALYNKGLKNFKFISVREDRGKDIIRELLNIETKVLIDPTMLLTSKEWKDIVKNPTVGIKEDYILICFLGEMSKEQRIQIENYAKKKKCRIIELNNVNKKEFYEAGPKQFLYYVANANIIFTDSFHVTVFSIIFQKEFWVFYRKGNVNMNSRIETLLNKFNLKDRITENNINKEKKIDYTNINNIIKKERQKSYDFLNKALKLNREN